MFTNAVSPDTLRGLEKLGKSGVLGNSYLAGGTALALQLGHRVSLDMDFFTRERFVELSLVNGLKGIGEFVPDQAEEQSILGTFGQTKFSIFYYEYPLVSATIEFEGLQLASPPDIAAMKLLAISDRGVTRDFVDLYYLRHYFPLEQVFDWYGQKYSNLEERKYHLLRGLSYFEDAEAEGRMPRMIKTVDWDEVKRYFEGEVKRLAREWGL